MGIRFAGAERYERTSFWGAVQPITAMCWFRCTTLPDGTNHAYRSIGPFQQSGGFGQGMSLFFTGGTVKFNIGTQLNDFPGTTSIAAGTWYHGTWTRSGSSHLGYLNGVQECSGTDAQSVGTSLLIGMSVSGDADPFIGDVAAVKIWTAVLTAAEILQEVRQIVPQRTANLAAWYPWLAVGVDDTLDVSGYGQTLTATGSPATGSQPPIPWRQGRRRAFVVAGAASDPALLLQLDTECMSAGRY